LACAPRIVFRTSCGAIWWGAIHGSSLVVGLRSPDESAGGAAADAAGAVEAAAAGAADEPPEPAGVDADAGSVGCCGGGVAPPHARAQARPTKQSRDDSGGGGGRMDARMDFLRRRAA
jgi:hypothetical protein